MQRDRLKQAGHDRCANQFGPDQRHNEQVARENLE
jgi:hypothetical protein